MNFDAGGKRWRKTYRGVKYEVYLRDLPVGEADWMEMGSYQAANDWWKGKLAEIRKSHPHAKIAELVHPRIADAERRGMTDEATANKELQNFIRHASQRYRFPPPTNLDNREYGWAVEVTEKQEVPTKGILAFLQPLPDRLKLYALLAWNTGVTNIAIAGLVRGPCLGPAVARGRGGAGGRMGPELVGEIDRDPERACERLRHHPSMDHGEEDGYTRDTRED